MEVLNMKKIYIILLVIVLISLSGCSDNSSETNSAEGMSINSVSLDKDESIKTPTLGFLPKIYDYVVSDNIKTMLIEVTDYSDINNPKIVSSYAYKLSKETLNGRIYLHYNTDENELSIELKTEKKIDKISNILDIYDKTDSYAMSFTNESRIKEGKLIPLIAILYADSFSEIENFLNNPKHHDGNYSSAYQISITFFDKDIKELN